jgi:hypothetical protein
MFEFRGLVRLYAPGQGFGVMVTPLAWCLAKGKPQTLMGN